MARLRRRCRLVLLAAVLLLGGAVVNVALAWGLVCRTRLNPLACAFPSFTTWAVPVPDTWPQPQETRRYELLGRRDSLTYAEPGYMLDVHEAGWRMQSLRGWRLATPDDGPVVNDFWFNPTALHSYGQARHLFRWNDHDIPLRPMWPGFAVNTLLYALALGLLFVAPVWIRRTLKRRRGGCASCGYDLRGLPECVCPECGRAF